jgi:hypothetical protein
MFLTFRQGLRDLTYVKLIGNRVFLSRGKPNLIAGSGRRSKPSIRIVCR